MARRQHGPLTIEEISKGLGACVDNINALVLDAEALLQADRPARALTCLLVAGQEMGKVQFLQAMLTFESDDLDRWKEIWKAFYNHRSKAAGGLLGLLGPTTPSSVVGPIVVELNAGIGGTAEEERNRTLYVDCRRQRPSLVIAVRRNARLGLTVIGINTPGVVSAPGE